MKFPLALWCLAFFVAASPAALSSPEPGAAAGIPLDAPWKVRIFALARAKFIHPAWGWQHSERDYLLGVELARGDGLKLDTDVLFAAAFLHDMAAFMPCSDAHMEHGACAALQSPAILRDAGFPAAKIPAVQAAERGHMFGMNPGNDPAAIVLHDADSLDFLGAIGAARMLSLTGEKAPSFAPAVRTLRKFLTDIPPRLITRTARRLGQRRGAELQAYLEALDDESRVASADRAASASVPRSCTGCDFSAATLAGSNFGGVTYVGTNFFGADLHGSSFRQARLIAANFQNADLRGASLDGAECVACNFAGAKFDGASFSSATIVASNFQDFSAAISDAQLRQLLSGCTACNFTGSELAGRDLSNTTLVSIDLSRADLRGARFDEAVMCWGTVHRSRSGPACDTMRDAQTSGTSFRRVRQCDNPMDWSTCSAVSADLLRQKSGSELAGAAPP